MSKREIRINSLWNKISRRFSEKLYLFFVALLFVAIAILIGIDIWYKPIFGLERDLAINLFTDSVIASLTVFLLSLFVILRQEREWRIVKDEVFFLIRTELAMLFDEILEILDGGLDFKVLMYAESDKQKRRQLLIEKFNELAGEVKLNSYGVSLLMKNWSSLDRFIDISKRLSNVELKYSKHLPAEVVFSLLRLQLAIDSLEQIRKLNYSMKGLASGPQTPTITEFLPFITKEIEKNTLGFAKIPTKEMLTNINKLYSIGFEFDYPFPG